MSTVNAYDSHSAIVSQLLSNQGTGTRSVGREMDKDAFLKLLLVQLQNQDPLEPISDTDFIAQMAQFSSLEQMQALNSGAAMERAQSLLNMDVMASAVLGSDGNLVSSEIYGKVQSVMNISGVPYVQIGEYLAPLSGIAAVANDAIYDNSAAQAAALVGKWAQVQQPSVNESGETVSITSYGQITSIQFQGLNTFAIINGKQVPLAYLARIADSMENLMIEVEAPPAPSTDI